VQAWESDFSSEQFRGFLLPEMCLMKYPTYAQWLRRWVDAQRTFLWVFGGYAVLIDE
jgi:hypothetical protein